MAYTWSPVFPAQVADDAAMNLLGAAVTSHDAILTQYAVLLNPPIAKLRQTVIQSLPNATNTPITFDTHDWDNLTGHSDSVNPSRYTCQYPGVYEAFGGGSFANNAVSWRFCTWAINGVLIPEGGALQNAVSGNTHRQPARSVHVRMVVGDYIELIAAQNSGGALNTAVATSEQASMNIRLIGL